MSFDSTSSYEDRDDLNVYQNKALKSTLSQRDNFPHSRHSVKAATKDSYTRQPPQSNPRLRTMSASEEASADTVTELTAMPTFSNKQDHKHDRRGSELKLPTERNGFTTADRRNSTPQLHLSALLPHPFRHPKNHHKTNTKDEAYPTSITSTNNASAATSFLHSADVMTMKTDPSFPMKSSTTINGLRLTPSNSSDQLLSNHSDDSISSSSFIFDEISSEPRSTELFILESHTPICVSDLYHNQFFQYFHTNYYGEFDLEGPFITSLRYFYQKTALTETCEARAIIRTQYRNCDISESVNGANESNILQILFNKAHLPPVRSYGTIGDPKANEKLHLLDKTNDERYNCKIGVIYQRTNQTNEYDIFCNDGLSKELKDFLDEISGQIPLKGFHRFRGDLDTRDNLHGDYSYYTLHENHEIMFNVAPIIPSTKANGQCIERKGLIGNAFVCIVFQEAGAIFSPDFISGKVTQIYITVQPVTNADQLYFKIGLWRRNDIKSVIDPPGGVYRNDKSFCNYFLTLLLNSVNVAIESPSLRPRIYEQRQRLKCEELRKLSLLFSLGPIPDFTSEIDNTHYNQIDIRPNTRSESITSNTTLTTSDSASTNPARTSPVLKKKTFSKKLFGVFSSRSGSISTPSPTPNSGNNDTTPMTPPPSLFSDGIMSLARGMPPSGKEPVKRTRSIKSSQAPTVPFRPINQHIPQTISIFPPTPAANSSNPIAADNLTQNNLINTAALAIAPRSRSNSSPEDTVNSNKSPSVPVAKIDEENQSVDSSTDDDDDEDTSEDEKPTNRSLIYSSNKNS